MESNPDVINEFVLAVGMPPGWGFTDCLGLDPELLSMSPQPVLAVILIYPWNEQKERERDERQAALRTKGAPGVWYMIQHVGDACGTIAVIHALANCREVIGLGDGSLKRFVESVDAMSPDEKGKALGRCAEIAAAHKTHAEQGQTDHTKYKDVASHFICFVHHDGTLFELDGARPSGCPVSHGPTSPERFLVDVARVIKTEFIDRDPEELNFGIITLGPI